ncbi:hypothetical protein G3M58_04445, partial [Streptomyces sp. SID7499]|nr:hypothetical protein [Streptomyces sp. SID7499]
KAQEEKKKKPDCIILPKSPPTTLTGCLMAGGEFDPQAQKDALQGYRATMWAGLGIPLEEIQACIDDPTDVTCLALALAVTPAGRIKKVQKAIEGVQEAAQASKVFRPIVTWGDDYLKMLRKHTNGGDLADDTKGI